MTLDDFERFTFHDPNVSLHCMHFGDHAVELHLTAQLFKNALLPVVPSDDPVTIQFSEVHMLERAVPPEFVIKSLWQRLFMHEFEEQLRRDGKQFFSPHG